MAWKPMRQKLRDAIEISGGDMQAADATATGRSRLSERILDRTTSGTASRSGCDWKSCSTNTSATSAKNR